MDEPAASTYIMSDQVSETKLIAALALFLITLLCGYLPVRVILNQNYVQHAMFAGGGVLMATAFCHLIPEAHDSYRAFSLAGLSPQPHNHNHHHQGQHEQPPAQATSNSSAPTTSLTNSTATIAAASTTAASTTTASPLATDNGATSATFLAKINGLNVPYLEMTLCCGFFFMYLVEQLMLRFIANHSHEHPCDTAANASSSSGGGASKRHQAQQQQQQQFAPGQLIIGAGETSQPLDYASDNGGCAPAGLQASANPLLVGSISSTTGSASLGNLSTSIMAANNSSDALDGPRRHRGQRPASNASELYKFVRGLLIVSAFGTHSIFDGVAIGSQESVEKVWTIFIAISCHKLIIAAVVGLELFAATLESQLWTLVHLVIFSIMSPVGILLVVLAQDALNINSEHPAMILLQSFATGTLLYIIFVEILQAKEDQYHAKHRLGKSVSLVAGFALMLTVLTLIDH